MEQVFTLTNSDSANIKFPGQTAPLPGTSITIQLKNTSLLVIGFDSRVFGITSDPAKTNGPFLALSCQIDGQLCEPNTNYVESYAVPGYGHAQSFTWVVPSATSGQHKIDILATGINIGAPPALDEIVITNRTLIVQAARLIRRPPKKGSAR